MTVPPVGRSWIYQSLKLKPAQNNILRVVPDVDAYPLALEPFRSDKRGGATSERVEHHVTSIA